MVENMHPVFFTFFWTNLSKACNHTAQTFDKLLKIYLILMQSKNTQKREKNENKMITKNINFFFRYKNLKTGRLLFISAYKTHSSDV